MRKEENAVRQSGRSSFKSSSDSASIFTSKFLPTTTFFLGMRMSMCCCM